jgi:nitric oxide reductase subunit B
MQNKRLWLLLGAVVFGSFAVLLGVGSEIYRQAPPMPLRVVSDTGETVFTEAQIQAGQSTWRSVGGQELGSIWGHGAYVAPDWSADWLHREATMLLEDWAQARHGRSFAKLDTAQQEALKAQLRQELRSNRYDPATGTLTLSAARAAVVSRLADYYGRLFGDAPELKELRQSYAMREATLSDPERKTALAAFFFWTAWSCVTSRPGSDVSYTNNWPADTLVGNTPTADAFLWTIISVLFLLAGIGALVWYAAQSHGRDDQVATLPAKDPFLDIATTPSMRATRKYFWTVLGLLLAQIGLGAVTAHYGVEGQAFYGIQLADLFPYALTRTWHTQLGIFWIATAWLATGLYLAPAITGYEPRFQRLGVDVLWIALLVIVVGSMAGQWFGIQQRLGHDVNFWFGHQGFEYVDLGRFWQGFLFAGLFIWLGLMLRPLVPALKRPSEHRQLLALFTLSCAAIGAFYGAGLMWGQHTHLAVAEYWRWWVVHLWVEGFFEVFATSIIAYLFVRMGLLQAARATTAVIFSTIVFLAGGVLGTFHHLYFTGTPTSVLALGASFSALEVAPLCLVGFEAYQNYKLSGRGGWLSAYRWPILFFVAVAFWNLVGAGLFGFLINPPLALYYMQGLNTTPVHGHTALFGVYGMLGIGLMLFCLRNLAPRLAWEDRWLKASFWTLNGGLAAMSFLSLLPIGLLQTRASFENGLWYARSAEFLGSPLMTSLKWLRVPGDILFSIGVVFLAVFFVRLFVRRGSRQVATVEMPAVPKILRGRQVAHFVEDESTRS